MLRNNYEEEEEEITRQTIQRLCKLLNQQSVHCLMNRRLIFFTNFLQLVPAK